MRNAPPTDQVWTTDKVGEFYACIAWALLGLAVTLALAIWLERL